MTARISLVELAHAAAEPCLDEGAVAIDATLGNGHDTLFLAQRVGHSGHVYGFDPQQAALDATRARLAEAGLEGRVTLIGAGHQSMRDWLPAPTHGKVAVVVFNLGYLPGSDKRLTTRADTTCIALDSAAKLLKTGGKIILVAYRGHAGGMEEAGAVARWFDALDANRWRVTHTPSGEQERAPVLWISECINQNAELDK